MTLDRQAAATTIVLEVADPYLRSEALWTVNGTAKTNVESCRYTLRWRYDEGMLADLVTRNDLAKLDLEVTVELVQQYNSADEVDDYRETHYGSPAGVVASETVYSGDLAVVFTQGTNIFDIDIPDVNWMDAQLTEPDPEGSEATRLTLSGMAVGPSASLLSIEATNADTLAYV